MTQLIEELLLNHATDTLGVPPSSKRRSERYGTSSRSMLHVSRILHTHHRPPLKRRHLFTSVALCLRHHFVGVLLARFISVVQLAM
jgi:hypothetical protein